MSYGPKRVVRRRAARALSLVAQAALAGMKTERHKTVSRKWKGPGHTIWSTSIDGVTIYRASRAALASIYLELRE
jgi:hypothetical protein